VKVATAGVGLRASHVLSLLKQAMPELEMVGYYDPSPTHLHDIDATMPRFTDVADMLSRTQPDLFFIGSPNSFHMEHIKITGRVWH